ncbi:MAG: hypothetical protein ABSF23_12330 [Terracidiphilus sp.]|jgi:hypothetical protein
MSQDGKYRSATKDVILKAASMGKGILAMRPCRDRHSANSAEAKKLIGELLK